MDVRKKGFARRLLGMGFALSLLGFYLDLPLTWHTDTNEQVAYRHSSVLWALLVWAVAMVTWNWSFRLFRKRRYSRGQKPERLKGDVADIGCLLASLAFLVLLALTTLGHLASRP
jgi:hypothetical protein